jgi:hypothetical protein
MMVQPVPEFELEPQDEALAELLTNPAATGNRRNWPGTSSLSSPGLNLAGMVFGTETTTT